MTFSGANLMLQETLVFTSNLSSLRDFFNLLSVSEVPEHQIHHRVIKMQKGLTSHVSTIFFKPLNLVHLISKVLEG